MDIRIATLRDLADVLAFYHQVSDAMIGTHDDCCWRRDGHPSPEFLESLVRDEGMIVAIEGDHIVAAVGVDHDLGHDYGALAWLADVSPDEVCVVHLLATLPQERGRGIAHKLLQACYDLARERGMRSVRLDATANNSQAIALYEGEGFQTVGTGYQFTGVGEDPNTKFFVMELLLV